MLNMDFSKMVVINTSKMDWLPSPAAGVWRKPLAREEVESGHATSIVKYEAGASFNAHNHPLGEEIFVLEGIFSDETGDYPAGSYIRNPKGFIHAPFSKEGCTLLVKLHQFQTDDLTQVRINTKESEWLAEGNGGIKVLPLHQHNSEQVLLVDWSANEDYARHKHNKGEEVYIISGELKDEFGSYPAGSWIRLPHDSEHSPYVEEDTLFWVKVGHLPEA
ncbi:cupin domain-containing protein [Gammaproteobacteria bacterium]|nr:cupin domain-containing protein [Gammaproteobacteria bacterium]MDC0598442.1 cupin domain-containing protein [Gammaproteobacteria bacterium]